MFCYMLNNFRSQTAESIGLMCSSVAARDGRARVGDGWRDTLREVSRGLEVTRFYLNKNSIDQTNKT